MDLNFNNCKILIVGDVMLDKYYFGKVERISPEAPVPIVNIVTEESRLGGASNVANNITSLGGQATLCGAIGYDFFGKEIERMAHRKGIKTDFVKTEQPTITKARIIGGRQQIVRIDYEQHLELSEKAREDFQIHLASLFQEFPTLVISDYGKGMISEELCSFLIKTAKSHRTRVIVDPKGQNWKKYTGADLITPNVKELPGTSNPQPLLNTKHSINNLNSDYYIEDGSFFRIRNVQLAYSFDQKLISRIGMQALKLYVNIQNLKTWKHNTGYTPELGGSAIAFGVDDGSYPMPAIYTFGFNVTF